MPGERDVRRRPAGQGQAKRYGVLYSLVENKAEDTGAVEVIAKAKDARQINRIYERMGYPAPVREDDAAKKADARAPYENSSRERGTGAKATTERTTASDRPSVKSRLAALKEKAEAARMAKQAIEPVIKPVQKNTPER